MKRKNASVALVESGAPSLVGAVCGFVSDDRLLCELFGIADARFDGAGCCSYLSSTFLVATDRKGAVVGGCGISIQNGLHLEALCVAQEASNGGVGTAIVEEAVRIGRLLNEKRPGWVEAVVPYGNDAFPDDERRQLTLEVHRDSEYKRFYTKNGFEMYAVPGVSTLFCRRAL